MVLSETLRTGLAELWAHKTRSALTLFAVAIGTAAFMYTFTGVANFNNRAAVALKLAGYGRMRIEQNRDYGEKPGQQQHPLTYEDAQAIRREMPDLRAVSPLAVNWSVKFRHGAAEYHATVMGIMPDWTKNDWVYKLRGRFFNETDMTSAARVCVIIRDGDWAPGKKPWWMKFWSSDWREGIESYLKHTDMLGDNIILGDHVYKVIGVLTEPPSGSDPRWSTWSYGQNVLIPLSSYMHFISDDSNSLRALTVDAGSADKIAFAKRRIEALLTVRHEGAEDFTVRSMGDFLGKWIAKRRKERLTILAIGSVALFAGGIGIMNVMLAVIFSRIKEIGIRRAIGAARRDILAQFVLEATMQGFIGGIIGIGLGFLLLKFMDTGDSRDLAFIWWVPPLSALIAAATGFIFSLYPAWTASRLDPVEALRSE